MAAAAAFAAEYGRKWPKSAAKITDDLGVLLGFYDYPASTGSTCQLIERPTNKINKEANSKPRDAPIHRS